MKGEGMNRAGNQLSDVEERRRVNLRALVAQHGQTNLARKLELANSSYIGHLKDGRKRITADGATKIETALGLSSGWLSEDHSASKTVAAGATVTLEPDLLTEALFAVQGIVDGNVEISRKKQAEIVTLVYLRAREQGRVDAQYVEQLVQLARQ